MPETDEATFLNEVIRLCGAGVALQLVTSFGGTSVYFSRNPEAHHSVARVIGRDAAKKIADEIAFGDVRVPMQGTSLTAITQGARRQQVQELHGQGLSQRRIARAVRCTERTVERDLAWLRAQGRLT